MTKTKKSKLKLVSEVSEEVKEEVAPTPTSSSIIYSGNVTINLVKGNKTIRTFKKHNTGYTPLFDFLTRCLAGLSTTSNDCPKYIRCFHSGGGVLSPGNLGVNVIRGEGCLAYSTVDQDSTTQQAVTYKFVIPSSMLDITVLGNNKIDAIAIYSTSNMHSQSNPSAYISIPTSKQIGSNDLGNGVSVIVLWEMTFNNSTVV